MNHLIEVVSVNLGQTKKIEVGHTVIETGIFKKPILEQVQVNENGLNGDAVVDQNRHGGKDQAVYLFSQEDYDWWSETLKRDLALGTFGENIVLSTFGPSPIKIGDRFQINDVLLEITFARVPCATLGARMGYSSFVKQFAQTPRPGFYARVLQSGAIQTGDTATYIPTAENYPTALELYAIWHSQERDVDLLRQGLAAPIADRARTAFEFWLNQAHKN